MTAAFTGAFAIACGVLLVSGAFKLVQPAGVAGAVQTLGVKMPRWGGRLIGSAEIAAGAAGLAAPGPIPAIAVGVAYLAFAVVVVALMRRGDASCGCFGQIESPPSGLHVAIDVGAAISALGFTAATSSSVFEYSRALAWGEAVAFFALVAIGVLCTVAILTVLPGVIAQTRAAASEAEARHERLHHHSHGTDLLQVEGTSDPA